MANILMLCHRIPYPPNKGDKIRAFNFLDHLVRSHKIMLAGFVDDPEDWEHVSALEARCEDVFFKPLTTFAKQTRAAKALLTNTSFTDAVYRDRAMTEWINKQIGKAPDGIFIYSSAMAQYVLPRNNGNAKIVMDFVDVDSEKWSEYAERKSGIVRMLYKREAKYLKQREYDIARQADHNVFVSQPEQDIFAKKVAPGVKKLISVTNGVDADYFTPDAETLKRSSEKVITFTGAMDYWPNIDAVTWFSNRVFPKLDPSRTKTTFKIVGMNPDRQVKILGQQDGIDVVGKVDDIRPYLSEADVCVAPMRVARGIQNKVLEAMAMGRPIVTTPEGCEGTLATHGKNIMIAKDETDFAEAVATILKDRAFAMSIGRAAREHILENFQWATSQKKIEALLLS